MTTSPVPATPPPARLGPPCHPEATFYVEMQWVGLDYTSYEAPAFFSCDVVDCNNMWNLAGNPIDFEGKEL